MTNRNNSAAGNGSANENSMEIDALKAKLDAFVEHERDLQEADGEYVDREELHNRLTGFVEQLQQQFDSPDQQSPANAQETESRSSEPTAEEEQPDLSIGELSNRDIVELEKEFNTYDIKAANDIRHVEHSNQHKIKQVVIGSVIAAAAMWMFWPTSESLDSESGKLVDHQVITTDKGAQNPVVKPSLTTAVKEDSSAGADIKVIEQKTTAMMTEAKIDKRDAAIKPIEAEPLTDSIEEAAPVVSAPAVLLKVNVDIANIRSLPATNADILARLKQGTIVSLQQQEGNWYQVSLSENSSGWGHGSLFISASGSPLKPVEAIATVLTISVDIGKIRTKPSTNSSVIHRLKHGATVIKKRAKGDWYLVELNNGTIAWAHKSIF